MANSLCKSSVQKTYQDVINDVIANIRDHFLEDGVDEQILQELKQSWEAKLKATKAVEDTKELEKIMQAQSTRTKQQDQIEYKKVQQQQLRRVQVPPNNHVTMVPNDFRRVPIQLTIPQLPGHNEGQKTLAIEVPEIFLQGNHLKNILTSSVVGAAMGLPVFSACAFLQELVNKAFIKHQQLMAISGINPAFAQSAHNSGDVKSLSQCDGAEDTSDDDDDEDNEDDDNVDQNLEDDFEEVDEEEAVLEDEPLNSEDDISDPDEAHSSFETDNVIVCQYDKITRSRNRWKFHFKDGIMNLHGEDYVFQKANGDAEW